MMVDAEILGVVWVPLNAYTYQPDKGRDEDPVIVNHLSDIFGREGCKPELWEHHIKGEIDAATYSRLLIALGISEAQFRSTAGTGRYPRVRLRKRIVCLDGRQRIAAARGKFGKRFWWPVKLYRDARVPRFSHQTKYPDGEICWHLFRLALGKPDLGGDWRSELSRSKKKILNLLLRRENGIFKHRDIVIALCAVLEFPGTRRGFKLGTMHKYTPLRCSENAVRYLQRMLSIYWGVIGGDASIVPHMDSKTISCLQRRNPSNNADGKYIRLMMDTGEMFSGVKSITIRRSITRNLLSLDVIFPSLETFHQNMIYFSIGVKILRNHIMDDTEKLHDRNPKDGDDPFFKSLGSFWTSPKRPLLEVSEGRFQPLVSLDDGLARMLLFLDGLRDCIHLSNEPILQDRRGEPVPPAAVDPWYVFRLRARARQYGFCTAKVSNGLRIKPQSPRQLHWDLNWDRRAKDWRGGKPTARNFLELQHDAFLPMLEQANSREKVTAAFVQKDFLEAFFGPWSYMTDGSEVGSDLTPFDGDEIMEIDDAGPSMSPDTVMQIDDTQSPLQQQSQHPQGAFSMQESLPQTMEISDSSDSSKMRTPMFDPTSQVDEQWLIHAESTGEIVVGDEINKNGRNKLLRQRDSKPPRKIPYLRRPSVASSLRTPARPPIHTTLPSAGERLTETSSAYEVSDSQLRELRLSQSRCTIEQSILREQVQDEDNAPNDHQRLPRRRNGPRKTRSASPPFRNTVPRSRRESLAVGPSRSPIQPPGSLITRAEQPNEADLRRSIIPLPQSPTQAQIHSIPVSISTLMDEPPLVQRKELVPIQTGDATQQRAENSLQNQDNSSRVIIAPSPTPLQLSQNTKKVAAKPRKTAKETAPRDSLIRRSTGNMTASRYSYRVNSPSQARKRRKRSPIRPPMATKKGLLRRLSTYLPSHMRAPQSMSKLGESIDETPVSEKEGRRDEAAETQPTTENIPQEDTSHGSHRLSPGVSDIGALRSPITPPHLIIRARGSLREKTINETSRRSQVPSPENNTPRRSQRLLLRNQEPQTPRRSERIRLRSQDPSSQPPASISTSKSGQKLTKNKMTIKEKPQKKLKKSSNIIIEDKMAQTQAHHQPLRPKSPEPTAIPAIMSDNFHGTSTLITSESLIHHDEEDPNTSGVGQVIGRPLTIQHPLMESPEMLHPRTSPSGVSLIVEDRKGKRKAVEDPPMANLEHSQPQTKRILSRRPTPKNGASSAMISKDKAPPNARHTQPQPRRSPIQPPKTSTFRVPSISSSESSMEKESERPLIQPPKTSTFRVPNISSSKSSTEKESGRPPIQPPKTSTFRVPSISSSESSMETKSGRPPIHPPNFLDVSPPAGSSEQTSTPRSNIPEHPQKVYVNRRSVEAETFAQTRLAYPEGDLYDDNSVEEEL
ncbi:uncharacterized protein F4807DRAFT_469168 [Annulohypoxylon truncatum]|uniref:uncharacterized protein n=1 Tax=Annulohypoxylon truncatum TaxID=327061 RepID=UPI002007254F|nr:uncharacterized protein F4807DRAFT_469168 [Annulohypoxylon truncatum]KAI1207658.1 hypothetical protein F4807DRAFT_469168 [Annulohypoxylon truncatum]